MRRWGLPPLLWVALGVAFVADPVGGVWLRHKANLEKYEHQQKDFGPVRVTMLGRTMEESKSFDNKISNLVADDSWNKFFLNVASMFLVKLLCGIDDMALLTALVGTKNKRQNNVNCMLYLTCILFIGIMSYFVAQFTYSILEHYINDGYWTVERVSALICGSLLILFGIKEAYTDNEEEGEPVEEETVKIQKTTSFSSGRDEVIIAQAEPLDGAMEGDDWRAATDVTNNIREPSDFSAFGNMSQRSDDVVVEASHVPKLEACCTRENSSEMVLKKPEVNKKSDGAGLFHYAGVITTLAVDDSIVFVCMIQGSEINLIDVMCGVMLGSLLIVMVCRFLSSIAFINDTLQKIPKWALIVGLGCWVALSSFVRLEIS